MKLSQDHWIKAVTIALCILLAIILIIAVNQYLWIVALLPFFILPLFRQIGWLEDLDERAQRHAYLSSHIAFLVLLFTIMVLEFDQFLIQEKVHQEWTGLLIIAVLTKLFAFAALNLRPRISGLAIGLLCGAFWILFAVLGNWPDPVAIAMQSILGLVVVLATLAGRRWPVQGAIILIALALALSYFAVAGFSITGRLSRAVFMLALLSAPPALSAGFYLYDKFRYEE